MPDKCKGDLHSLIPRPTSEFGPVVIRHAFVCKHCGHVPEIELAVLDDTGPLASLFGQTASDG